MTASPPTNNGTSSSSDSEYWLNPFNKTTLATVGIETAAMVVAQKILGPLDFMDLLSNVVYSGFYEAVAHKGTMKMIGSTNADLVKSPKAFHLADELEYRVVKFAGMSVLDLVIGNMLMKDREGMKHVFLKQAMTQGAAGIVAYMMEGSD